MGERAVPGRATELLSTDAREVGCSSCTDCHLCWTLCMPQPKLLLCRCCFAYKSHIFHVSSAPIVLVVVLSMWHLIMHHIIISCS